MGLQTRGEEKLHELRFRFREDFAMPSYQQPVHRNGMAASHGSKTFRPCGVRTDDGMKLGGLETLELSGFSEPPRQVLGQTPPHFLNVTIGRTIPEARVQHVKRNTVIKCNEILGTHWMCWTWRRCNSSHVLTRTLREAKMSFKCAGP